MSFSSSRGRGSARAFRGRRRRRGGGGDAEGSAGNFVRRSTARRTTRSGTSRPRRCTCSETGFDDFSARLQGLSRASREIEAEIKRLWTWAKDVHEAGRPRNATRLARPSTCARRARFRLNRPREPREDGVMRSIRLAHGRVAAHRRPARRERARVHGARRGLHAGDAAIHGLTFVRTPAVADEVVQDSWLTAAPTRTFGESSLETRGSTESARTSRELPGRCARRAPVPLLGVRRTTSRRSIRSGSSATGTGRRPSSPLGRRCRPRRDRPRHRGAPSSRRQVMELRDVQE